MQMMIEKCVNIPIIQENVMNILKTVLLKL